MNREIIRYFCVPVMAASTFQFKQFTIAQDRCAMKVGTDGVLLGAWARAREGGRVLDIGCGTGLISLMVAQRFPGSGVTGVEVDAEAARQARENVAGSPFASRVEILQGDVRDFEGSFSTIVCNPPFFTERVVSPCEGRRLARSTCSLSFGDLWESVCRLLLPDGLFNVIIPTSERVAFHTFALEHGFSLWQSCAVQTVPAKAPKRVLLCYVRGECTPLPPQHLVLQDADDSRSADLSRLTADFYLW